MISIIIFFIVCFLIDYVACGLSSKLLCLRLSSFEIITISTLSFLLNFSYIMLNFSAYIFIISKIILLFLCSYLMVDCYDLKLILKVWVISIAGFIFVFGCFSFAYILAKSIFKKYNIFLSLVICVITSLYVIFMMLFVKKYTSQNKAKNFKQKVSFSIFGKHISLTGLLDSGNILYDDKLKKDVVIVEKNSLKKYFSKNELDLYLKCLPENICHKLKVKTISGETEILVIDSYDCRLENSKVNFAIGLIDIQLSANGEFECILGQNFM